MSSLYNLYTLHCIGWQEGARLLQEVRVAACKLGVLDPLEVQPDDMDEQCRHALALSASGQAVGCVRITPNGKIERLAVLSQEHRNQLESALIETILKEMLSEYSCKHRTEIHPPGSTRNRPQTGRLAA